jgi:hypothetical protein
MLDVGCSRCSPSQSRGPAASFPHFSFPCRAVVGCRREHFSFSAFQLFPGPNFTRRPNRHLFRNFVLTLTRRAQLQFQPPVSTRFPAHRALGLGRNMRCLAHGELERLQRAGQPHSLWETAADGTVRPPRGAGGCWRELPSAECGVLTRLRQPSARRGYGGAGEAAGYYEAGY